MQERSVGTQAPILTPKSIGIALEYVTLPVAEKACKIPTVADELCIIAQGLDTLVINGNVKKLISHISELKKQYNIF